MGEIAKKVVEQFTSGRWLLTLICGVAFLYCVITKQLEGATITAILISVFNSYFDKKDRKNDVKPDSVDKTKSPS